MTTVDTTGFGSTEKVRHQSLTIKYQASTRLRAGGEVRFISSHYWLVSRKEWSKKNMSEERKKSVDISRLPSKKNYSEGDVVTVGLPYNHPRGMGRCRLEHEKNNILHKNRLIVEQKDTGYCTGREQMYMI